MISTSRALGLLCGLFLVASCASAPPTGPARGRAGAGSEPGVSATQPRLLAAPDGITLTLREVAVADMPAAFAVSREGRLYVGELTTGRILLAGRVVADVAVSTGGESGLESLAVTGDALYAYVSVPEGDPSDPGSDGGQAEASRVLRFPVEGDGGLGQPQTIVSVPGAGLHNAGSVGIGPDGLVYVNIGDNIRRGASQDLASPFGKILRLTPEGRPAPGNPFADRPDADPRVWAWGIRNTFGFGWLRNGRMVGADNGERAGDEINLLRAGMNYGWPPEAGVSDGMAPLVTWPDTFAPAGLEAVPPGWASWSQGSKVLVCGVVANRMDLVDLDQPERSLRPVLDGCPLHIAADPSGGILFSTWDGVWRLSPEG